MLRCSDNSYNVGSTSQEDVEARVVEHNEGRFKGYTSKRRPVTLVWCDQFLDLKEAHAAERRLKGWRREKKEALIRGEFGLLPSLAKRPTARRPSRAAARPPQGDALSLDSNEPSLHAEVRCAAAPRSTAPAPDEDDQK
jgi:putative endonuclease